MDLEYIIVLEIVCLVAQLLNESNLLLKEVGNIALFKIIEFRFGRCFG